MHISVFKNNSLSFAEKVIVWTTQLAQKQTGTEYTSLDQGLATSLALWAKIMQLSLRQAGASNMADTAATCPRCQCFSLAASGPQVLTCTLDYEHRKFPKVQLNPVTKNQFEHLPKAVVPKFSYPLGQMHNARSVRGWICCPGSCCGPDPVRLVHRYDPVLGPSPVSPHQCHHLSSLWQCRHMRPCHLACQVGNLAMWRAPMTSGTGCPSREAVSKSCARCILLTRWDEREMRTLYVNLQNKVYC